MSIGHFHLGDWEVIPDSNTLRLGVTTNVLEPKAMDVLVLLCQNQGEVFSAEVILSQCWPSTEVGDNPVHKVITQLRKALGDKASSPLFIETIRKRGYRVIADVSFPFDDQQRAEMSDWQGLSPFPGLSAFEPADADVFFGRNEQVQLLLEQIAIQAEFGRAFTLILGPSGTGKSSLINAGVLPKLQSKNGFAGIGVVSHASLDFADVSQSRLFLDIASAMLDWDVNDQPVFDGWSAETLAEKLVDGINEVVEICRIRLNDCDKRLIRSPRFFLFVDRLEVLLSSPLFSEDEREQALACIDQLANSGSIIVFSACRNDFYPLVVRYPSLMKGKAKGAHFDLLAPTRAELMQMIRMPAIAAGLNWSTDKDSAMSLDELLCNEAAANPDSLPMLQYTLQELYLHRSDENELQVSVYKALGGIEGAIGKKAEEIYASFDKRRQDELDAILSLVVTLSPDGETITSRAARWSQLSTQSQTAFAQAMVDSRLFVSHLQNDEACFSVAHEALLRKWSRATDWVNAHRDSLSAKSRLRQLTDNWIAENKNSAYLLAEGKPLQEAITLTQHNQFSLDADEQMLVTASSKRVQTKRWIARSTITLLCLLTLTSVFMSFRSQHAQILAEEKRQEAESLLGFMVGEFADKLRSVRRMDLLDGISNKALEYFSAEDESQSGWLAKLPFRSDSRSFEARYQHAQTLLAMGEVAYSRDKINEAKQAFLSAKTILGPLLDENPSNFELLTTIGANAFWLGQLAYDDSDFDTAFTHFVGYKTYSERMNELEPDNADAWYELSSAENTLGSLYLKNKEYLRAKKSFSVSLSLIEKSIGRFPEDSLLQVDKADTLSWLASSEQHIGNVNNTLNLLSDGQSVLEKVLKNESDNANYLEPLAYSYWQQARLYYFLESYTSAHMNLVKAQNLLEVALQQDPNNEIWRGDIISVSMSRKLVANILKQNVASSGFGLSFEPASIKRPHTLTEVISYLHSAQEWETSKRWIEHTDAYLTSMSENRKFEPDFISALSKLEILKAIQANYEGDFKGKEAACEQTIKTLAPLTKHSANIAYLLPYVKAHHCIGLLDEVAPETYLLKSLGITQLQL